MKSLRKNLFKNFLSLLVLGLFTIKLCAYSISAFRSSASLYTIEKSSEESKGSEEESFDKLKKKLLLYETFLPENPTIAVENIQEENAVGFGLYPCSFPFRNVPTPPPDHSLQYAVHLLC